MTPPSTPTSTTIDTTPDDFSTADLVATLGDITPPAGTDAELAAANKAQDEEDKKFIAMIFGENKGKNGLGLNFGTDEADDVYAKLAAEQDAAVEAELAEYASVTGAMFRTSWAGFGRAAVGKKTQLRNRHAGKKVVAASGVKKVAASGAGGASPGAGAAAGKKKVGGGCSGGKKNAKYEDMLARVVPELSHGVEMKLDAFPFYA